MSTTNFYNDRFFDLFVSADDETAEFVDENELDWAIQEATKELKREPQFFELKLESGYYSGVQIRVFETNCCKYYGNPHEQDNEGCRYYFDMCRSKAIRKFESEKQWLNKKLLPAVAKLIGFRKLNCVGVFSNGEAVYEWAK